MIIFGINPVFEALRAGRVRACGWQRGDKRVEEVFALARERGVRVERVDAAALDRAARGGVHQGVVAELEPPRDYSVEELVAAAAPEPPLIVVLDGIEDPHNIGAILRSVDAAGAHGVVRQARHAAPLDGVAMKASAGAAAHVRIATVVNIARAVEELKDAGVWTVGLAGRRAGALRRRSIYAADGARARRGGHRAPSAGPGALRPAGVDPDAGGGQQPECVGGGGSCAVRGGTGRGAASEGQSDRPASALEVLNDCRNFVPVACARGMPCATITLLSGLA